MAGPEPIGQVLPRAVAQLELRVPDTCERCGRPWNGERDTDHLYLDVLAKLPPAEFWAAIACWTGRCGGK